MTEKDLINQLHTLKQIKPRKEWVFSLKDKILINPIKLGKSPTFVSSGGHSSGTFNRRFAFLLGHKLAFASVGVFAVLIGVFVLSQNALPGEPLYSIRRLTEQGQGFLASDQQKLVFEVANKRLNDVVRVAQTNKDLAPAISEYNASASQAAKSLKDKQISKNIIAEVKKLEEKKQQIELLGANIGSNDLENALNQLVENEIKDLETRTLTDSQAEILVQIKLDFEAGNYSKALESILSLNLIEK